MQPIVLGWYRSEVRCDFNWEGWWTQRNPTSIQQYCWYWEWGIFIAEPSLLSVSFHKPYRDFVRQPWMWAWLHYLLFIVTLTFYLFMKIMLYLIFFLLIVIIRISWTPTLECLQFEGNAKDKEGVEWPSGDGSSPRCPSSLQCHGLCEVWSKSPQLFTLTSSYKWGWRHLIITQCTSGNKS